MNSEIYMPEIKSSYDSDQNRFQRRHFSNKTSSKIFFYDMSREDNASSGNDGVDRRELFYPSAGHDTRYAGQKQFERRHFHSPSESSNIDWDELLFPSAGHYKRYADQQHGERLHFHSPSEDHMQQKSNINRYKQINSSGTVELRKVKSDGDVQNQRHHFYEKNSSDIVCHLSTDGNVSSGSASVDREELLFPSAGQYKRFADQEHGERRHFR